MLGQIHARHILLAYHLDVLSPSLDHARDRRHQAGCQICTQLNIGYHKTIGHHCCDRGIVRRFSIDQIFPQRYVAPYPVQLLRPQTGYLIQVILRGLCN